MTLNVSNNNGTVLADHFLDPQSIPRVLNSTNQFLIDIWVLVTMPMKILPGIRIVTCIPAGIRNRCIGVICCNLTDT